MKPPPLRPLLPPAAIRRRRRRNFSPTLSYFTFASYVSAHSSFATYISSAPAAPFHTYFPAAHRPTLSAIYHIKQRNIISQSRDYAIQTPGPLTLQVFNAATKHRQRERTASHAEASRRVDYLRDEVATRLCERLLVYLLDFWPFHTFRFVVRAHSIPSTSIIGGNLGHQTPLPTHPRPGRQCL